MNLTTPTADARPLSIEDCLAHLDQEEVFLTETLRVLQEIRTALTTRDTAKLEQLPQQQHLLTQTAQDLFAHRLKLRQAIARELNVRLEDVTLSALVGHLPAEYHDEILRRRDRLSQLVVEVQTLQRTNAALIQQSVHLLNKILAGVYGQPAEPGYAPSGEVAYADREPMFQTRC